MKQAIEAYRIVSVAPEFREMERMRSKARHDEAQALYHTRRETEKAERKKWQGVIADKNAEIADKNTVIAEKDAEIARLRAQLKK